MNFTAIDFETANDRRSSACSVAVVEVTDGKLRDAFYALIRPPQHSFNYRNIQIHGITPQDVADKPEFPEIWRQLRPWLENRLVLAHNASFDMSVLRETLLLYGLALPNFQHCCTVRIAKKVWPELENHKLGTLGNYFHIDFQHHNALDDARTCATIALLAARARGAHSFAELTAQLGVAVKPFAGGGR